MPQVPTLAGSTEITNRGDYLSWAFSGVGWMLCHLVDPIVIRLIFRLALLETRCKSRRHKPVLTVLPCVLSVRLCKPLHIMRNARVLRPNEWAEEVPGSGICQGESSQPLQQRCQTADFLFSLQTLHIYTPGGAL